MSTLPITCGWSEVPVLLRGEPRRVSEALDECTPRRLMLYLVVILVGAGAFGAVVGYWRAPLQAVFTAIKFPLILLLTSLGNALLNGMLAPLLGLNLRFRQSLLAILMSFTIAAAILGSFSPILWFLVWNTPPMGQDSRVLVSYNSILLTQALVIAFAGIAANLRLLQLLRRLSGSRTVALKILFSWLAGNLLLGAQLSWNFRPFVGSPGLPLQFLRPDAFHGNFFEGLFNTLRYLLGF